MKILFFLKSRLTVAVTIWRAYGEHVCFVSSKGKRTETATEASSRGLTYKSLPSLICVLSAKSDPWLNACECQTISYSRVHMLVANPSLTEEPQDKKQRGPA